MPAVPKPPASPAKIRKYLLRGAPPRRKKWLARGTKRIPQVNRKAAARRHASYAKVLRSAFHKQLRYRAYLRSRGLCECDVCAYHRKAGNPTGVSTYANGKVVHEETYPEVIRAVTEIPVWFTSKGGEPWRRFRSTDGETHHDSYRLFGQENDDELSLVRWMWKACHRRIEAEHETRRRFLRGK